MLHHERRSRMIFGALFGAWLGFVYAFVSQAVNWMAVPDVPLGTPSGSLSAYLVQYFVTGMVLGIVSAIPEHRLVGSVLGGLFAALMSSFIATLEAWYLGVVGRTLVTVLITFLPLVVIMTPLAYVIRLGVDAQALDPSRPHLWARRYLIPLLVTGMVVLLGSFSLHSREVRQAFQSTNQLVQDGLRAQSADSLPRPLQDVRGFLEDADGTYSLIWSDRIDTFFGPRPVGAELSQFLVITRFENGFAFACLYSGNRTVPTCTNYR